MTFKATAQQFVLGNTTTELQHHAPDTITQNEEVCL